MCVYPVVRMLIVFAKLSYSKHLGFICTIIESDKVKVLDRIDINREAWLKNALHYIRSPYAVFFIKS